MDVFLSSIALATLGHLPLAFFFNLNKFYSVGGLFILFTLTFYSSNFNRKVDNLKELIYLLMDKPYEVRIERVDWFGFKVKIIIEENLTSNGGSVIKEKSRHITAYTNLRLSRKDLTQFTLELVQKAESTFSK